VKAMSGGDVKASSTARRRSTWRRRKLRRGSGVVDG